MFDIKVGVPFLTQLHAEAERLIVRMAEDRLIQKEYEYVSVPSLLKKETFDRQAHITWNQVTRIENYRSDEIGLSGSAEQGILEMYTNSFMLKPLKLFATNQCFRDEPLLEGLKSVREFKKVEQFAFCKPEDSSGVFEEFLANHTQLMSDLGLKYRWTDQTNLDRGYHKKKIDVEVLTSIYQAPQTIPFPVPWLPFQGFLCPCLKHTTHDSWNRLEGLYEHERQEQKKHLACKRRAL